MDTTYAKWGSRWHLLYRCAFPLGSRTRDSSLFEGERGMLGLEQLPRQPRKMLAPLLLGHVRGPRDQNNLDSLLANPEEIVFMCFEF